MTKPNPDDYFGDSKGEAKPKGKRSLNPDDYFGPIEPPKPKAEKPSLIKRGLAALSTPAPSDAPRDGARRGGTTAELRQGAFGADEPAAEESAAGAGRGFVNPDVVRSDGRRGGTPAALREGAYVAGTVEPPAPTPTAGELLETPRGDFQPSQADLEWQSLSPAKQQEILALKARRGSPGAVASEPGVAETIAANVRDATSNPVARGAVAGFSQLGQTGVGAVRAVADAVGADGVADFAAGASGKATQIGTGATRDLKGNDKLVADVSSSILNSAPALAVGMAGGAPLRTLFAQSALAEYNSGRDAGFSPAESATRAGIMGLAESLGERFGLPQQIALLKSVAKHVPTGELAKTFGSMIAREIPGEQLTTAMQFLADKLGPAALNPNASLADYLNQAGETLKVTIGQTAVMGGGPAAIGTVRDTYSKANRTTAAPEQILAQAIDQAAAQFGLNTKAAATLREKIASMDPDAATNYAEKLFAAAERAGLVKKPGGGSAVRQNAKDLAAKAAKDAEAQQGDASGDSVPAGAAASSDTGLADDMDAGAILGTQAEAPQATSGEAPTEGATDGPMTDEPAQPGVEAGAAPPIEGEPINKAWSAFTPESGTLNIPREQMPQVDAEHRGALVQFLGARGITHESAEVPADSLKPTQAEFSPKKVEHFAGNPSGRSILVSQDGYVLDGHHQWMAKRAAGEPVKVIRLNAPIQDLLRLAHQFPSSTTSKGPRNAVSGNGAGPDGGRSAQPGPADAGDGRGTGDLVQGELPQPGAAGAAGRPVPGADAGGVPGATGSEPRSDALTAGQSVTIDGKPYTVKSAKPKSIVLTDAAGKSRTITSDSATWAKVQPAGDRQADGRQAAGDRQLTSGPRILGKIGRTPNAAETVELRPNKDGTLTPHQGKYAMVDYETGEPVVIPGDSTNEQAIDAIKKSGAMGAKDKWFGVQKEQPDVVQGRAPVAQAQPDQEGAPAGGVEPAGAAAAPAVPAAGSAPVEADGVAGAVSTSAPMNRLGNVMRRAGWEIDYIDLDLTGDKPKADIRVHRGDGRFILAKVDGQGRAMFETFQRDRNLRMDPKNPQSRMAPHLDDTFLGRQKFEGARSMLRGMVTYLSDNATNPVALADMKAAWAGVMAGPVNSTQALPAPAAAPAPAAPAVVPGAGNAAVEADGVKADEPWKLTREQAAKDYPGDEYDKMVNRAADLGDITYDEAAKISRINSATRGRHFWAKTRKQVEADNKAAVKAARDERADFNKMKPSEGYAAWRIRANNVKNKAAVESAIKYGNDLLAVHKDRVQEALMEGKDVPAEVLADYPDLKRPAATPNAEAPASTQAPAPEPTPKAQGVAKQAQPQVTRFVTKSDMVGSTVEWQEQQASGDWMRLTTFDTMQQAKDAAASRGYDAEAIPRFVSEFSASAKRFLQAVPEAAPAERTPKAQAVKEALAGDRQPFEHAGLKVYPTKMRRDGAVVDVWAVQLPENKGTDKVLGDMLHTTIDEAKKSAEYEAKRDNDRKEWARKEEADRADSEAKKEANRGKNITERAADFTLNQPNKLPPSAGLGTGTRREAMDKAVEQGRAIRAETVEDTAAKNRDKKAVEAVSKAGYLLGLSNENIPVVKAGLEARARLKADKYPKIEYRVYGGRLAEGPFHTITKIEYDYAVQRQAEQFAAEQDRPTPAPMDAATHKDPGEPAEPVTPAVVREAIKTGVQDTGRKPSAMRAELLREIDRAIEEAPDYQDFQAVVKTMGLKDATAVFTDAKGTMGEKGAPAGYSRPKRTFKVEGDGVFTIQNSVRQLLTFRAKVESSPGFKDRQAPAGLNERATDALDRRSTDAAIANMVDEGDFQAALDFAEAKGVDIGAVKLTKLLRDRLEKWQKDQASAKAVADYEAARAEGKPAPGSLAAAFAEKDAAADDFALGQEPPKPVDKKVAAKDLAGQKDIFGGATPFADPLTLTERQLNSLRGKPITMKAQTEDGQVASWEIDAAEAVQSLRSREATIQQLVRCLS